MIKDFILPDIGEGIVECELVEWLIKEGDRIEEDQPVADVMTDKALVQIPAPYAGRVSKLYYRQGDSARVHAPLFAVEVDNGGADPAGASMTTPVTTPVTGSAPLAPAAAAVTRDHAPGAAEDFILPDIGEGIVECEVVEWLVAEGERIEEDQPVVDVMTDKALVQIPAHKSGVISKLYCRQGETARVHAPLFALIPDDGQAQAAPETAREAAVEAAQQAPITEAQQAPARVPGAGKALASPAVRRIAREREIDIGQVPGSGRNGRVLKEDILRFAEKGAEKGAEQASAVTTSQGQPAPGEVRIEPIRGIKAAMVKQMTLSHATIPHFTYGDEVDVTALLALRSELKAKAEQRGIRLTLMPFIMKALATAIQQYPILNSRVNEACTEIHYQPHCNIGMAVDSKLGLIVPNIKKVETLSILEIAQEVTRLTEAARSGRVSQADLADGTISISNIGALGGTYAVPVVNPPEVAIVALGKTRQLPRFDARGEVSARSIMNISWSGDHRIIDGGTIARFSLLWQSYLEDPASLLLELS